MMQQSGYGDAGGMYALQPGGRTGDYFGLGVLAFALFTYTPLCCSLAN